MSKNFFLVKSALRFCLLRPTGWTYGLKSSSNRKEIDFCLFTFSPEKIFIMNHFQILSERSKVLIFEHFWTNGLTKVCFEWFILVISSVLSGHGNRPLLDSQKFLACEIVICSFPTKRFHFFLTVQYPDSKKIIELNNSLLSQTTKDFVILLCVIQPSGL